MQPSDSSGISQEHNDDGAGQLPGAACGFREVGLSKCVSDSRQSKRVRPG
jgi:hypothetical protein